jgi:nucleotide-binding universal stress UspA family protein
VAALRWACREASFSAAEVLAVLALESSCHQIASYAVPVPRHPRGSWGAVRDVLRRAVGEAVSQFPGVSVRTDITEGLAARVLLDHASDADMLVLGRTPYGPDPRRAAGPVTRACLRASVCPVVIIGSGPTDPLPEVVPGTPQAAERPADHAQPSRQRDLEGSGATR